MLIKFVPLRETHYFTDGELRDKVDGWPLKCLIVIKWQREAGDFSSYAFAFATAVPFM